MAEPTPDPHHDPEESLWLRLLWMILIGMMLGVAQTILQVTALIQFILIRPPTLDRPKAEFSGFAQGDGLVTPPDFVSVIGTLFPIAPCGRSSL